MILDLPTCCFILFYLSRPPRRSHHATNRSSDATRAVGLTEQKRKASRRSSTCNGWERMLDV